MELTLVSTSHNCTRSDNHQVWNWHVN